MTSSKVEFQASKSKGGLSPKASMTDTTLCQVCYPKGLPKAQVTSHHPRGRWPMVKGQEAKAMCTRHHSKALSEGWKVDPATAKALTAAKRAKSKASKAKAQEA